MTTDALCWPFLNVRVVYIDWPDTLQLEVRVKDGSWSGVVHAYTSPTSLETSARGLATFAEHLKGEAIIEAGADSGIGWCRLRVHPVDKAMHLACQVQLATSECARKRPQEEVRRLVMDFATEPGLVTRFADELASLSLTGRGDAVLRGVI